MALALSSSVFAATATLEYQNQNGVNGSADTNNINLTVKEAFNKNFTGDVQLSNTYNDSNGAANSFRGEAGLTGSTPIVGTLGLYTRVAAGQKFTSTTNFTYYSVEPGITAGLGGGFNAKLGYRFRDAFDNNTYADQTRTVRAGLSYDINSKNTVDIIT